MRSVDTNVLVRALTGDDPSQSPAAMAFIKKFSPVWISHAVLMETVWVLESVYDQARPQLAEVLARISDNTDFALDEPTVVRAALALYRSKGKLDFCDCLILQVARKAGQIPLATFDKALGKAEGAETLTP
jgi:predicted nucleic-acid-binding protein